MQKKGLRSIFSNVPETGIGGGTAGQRIIYENLINNPILRNIFNIGGRALQFGSKALGPFSLFMPSRELGSGELPQELFDQQMQQAIRQEQEETQQKIINEVKESGGISLVINEDNIDDVLIYVGGQNRDPRQLELDFEGSPV